MTDEHTMYSPPPEDTPPPPATAGARMRDLRIAADMSGVALAQKMTAKGFHWHQTTVVRIEAGKRELHLTEAAQIAGIFGVPLDSLASPAATS